MKKPGSLVVLAAAVVLAGGGLTPGQTPPGTGYDVLIREATVYDGSGGAPFKADVAIVGETIVKVGQSIPGPAKRLVEAKGLALAPGFIDLHTHVDEGMYFPENRSCLNYLKQGVTTVVAGQCGSSAWPIFETADDLKKMWTSEGIGPNAALLVGHGTVRRVVMGMDNRPPTSEELDRMKALVREAMDQGAVGLSTGLIYEPSSFGRTEEIIELARVVTPYGGIYHTHIRNERQDLLAAVREAVEISEKAGLPAHISHFKVMGKSNWGLVKDACAIIENARAKGLKVTADQYPFPFSNQNPYASLVPRSVWTGSTPDRLTSRDLARILEHLGDSELVELYRKATPYYPLSARHLGFLSGLSRSRLVDFVSGTLFDLTNVQGATNPRERALFLRRLSDPDEGPKIRDAVRKTIIEGNGPEQYLVGMCAEKALEGKTLRDVAALKGLSVEDAAIALDLMGAQSIPVSMSEADLATIMAKDYVGTGSDGAAPFYGVGNFHIRSYSTFLHKIKKYALENKTISVAAAVRSQTSLPASIMGWTDRGWVREGAKADLVILDLARIRTPATVSNPHQYAEGVVHLFINGRAAIDRGVPTGALPGRILAVGRGGPAPTS
jgi:N-acyl-D-aspartate/D-glutamate deacylase